MALQIVEARFVYRTHPEEATCVVAFDVVDDARPTLHERGKVSVAVSEPLQAQLRALVADALIAAGKL